MYALHDVDVVELSQITAPLSDSDRARLTEYWSRVVAEAGADLPVRGEAPARSARRARRVQRQWAVRLVRVLSGSRRDAFSRLSGVAA